MKCVVVDHDEDISGICINKQCNAGNRTLCIECLYSIHSDCQNQVYLKKEFIKVLIDLKTQIQSEQTEEMNNLRNAIQVLLKSINILEQFIQKLLEQTQNIKTSQIKRIDEIIENQQLMSASAWKDGYDLINSQQVIIPMDLNGLLTSVNQIKLSVDQVTFSNFEKNKNQNPVCLKTSHFVQTIAISPNNQNIASAGYDDYQIQIWDLRTGQQVGQNLSGHEDTITSIRYSSCGNFLVSGSLDQTIKQWDIKSQKQIGDKIRGHTNIIQGVQYSSDCKFIVSCSWDKTIRVWDSQTGQELCDKRIQHSDYIWSISLQSHSTQMVFGDDRGRIVFWDYDQHIQQGEPLLGHTKCVYTVQYSRDNKLVVSGSDDLSICIWDAIKKLQIGQNLMGHTGSYIYSVNFSPDMQQIISGGSDQTIRLWDVKSGKQNGESLLYHNGGVLQAQFSWDGKYIISSSDGEKLIGICLSRDQ